MKNNHTIFLSAIALSALVLAGCSSSSETAPAPSPSATTPLDLGTYIPPSSSASASSSPSASSSDRTAAAPSQTASSAGTRAAGAGAVPTLASGKSVEMTDAELAKYRAGEYVPATDKHPAYNVPVPVMPADANSSSAENAEKFVTYWGEQLNYSLTTGDNSRFVEITNAEHLEVFINVTETASEIYREGGWLADLTYKVDVISSENSILKDSYLVKVDYGRSAGVNYKFDGSIEEQLSADDAEAPVNIRINWDGEKWLVDSFDSEG